MEFDHIIKLPPEELYEKALKFYQDEEFKIQKDYKNYCMYMTMAANYGYKLAEEFSHIDRIFRLLIENQTSNIKKFYEITINYSYSMFFLAMIHSHGLVTSLNLPKSIELFEGAIAKGNKYAMKGLADHYYHDNYTTIETFNKARHLYELAIENNYPDAFDNLARMYRDSILKNDIHQVIDYFSKINQLEKLKIIYRCDNDKIIQLIGDYWKQKEKITQLEKENNDLKTHIMASPDGELYFQAKESWNANV